MDTGSIRSSGFVPSIPSRSQDPPQAVMATRGEVAAERPTETERPATTTAVSATASTDVTSEYIRDPNSGTMVFQRIDAVTSQILLQLPRIDKTGRPSAYTGTETTGTQASAVGAHYSRSV
jgi:hypothetical protein